METAELGGHRGDERRSDPEGQERTRAARIRLNLAALGVPKGLGGEQLRVGELLNDLPNPRYLGHLKWVQDLPRNPRGKPLPLPAIQPKLNAGAGTIDGFDVPYHHVRYLVLSWNDKPIADAAWKAHSRAGCAPPRSIGASLTPLP